MSKTSVRLTAVAAALSCAAALSWTSPARAERAQATTTEEGYMPNRVMLATGLVLWGVPYTVGDFVAAQSSNQADHHLYIPIVGPWIDLTQRGGCPVASNSCNTETTNKVLLVGDGIFQAIGTLDVVFAFLRPEHRDVVSVSATRYTPRISFTPAQVSTGYGLAAFAVF